MVNFKTNRPGYIDVATLQLLAIMSRYGMEKNCDLTGTAQKKYVSMKKGKHLTENKLYQKSARQQ